MVCGYFKIREGKSFCRAYGRLEKCSQEKILECESNFANCLEIADEFLKMKDSKEKGVGEYLATGVSK